MNMIRYSVYVNISIKMKSLLKIYVPDFPFTNLGIGIRYMVTYIYKIKYINIPLYRVLYFTK